MVGLVLACPGHPRLSHEGAAKKGVDASDKRQAAWRQRIACYLPPSQVEAPRTRNRSKIKAVNVGSKLTFLPLPAMQKLLQFCHINGKILSIAIT
jgi:hypothetical protein